jgi:ABC-type sugar transport system substrate-binding protein
MYEFSKTLPSGIEVVGNDEYFAAEKEGRRLRRAKLYSEAIAKFWEARVIAQRSGFGTGPADEEIARTWWHQGNSEKALAMAEALLPSIGAVKLVLAILREDAHGAMKQELYGIALERLQRMKSRAHAVDLPLLTARDRAMMREASKHQPK